MPNYALISSMMFTLWLFVTLASETWATWEGPENIAVVVGRPMTMRCYPSPEMDSIDWYYTPLGSSEKRSINQGRSVARDFGEFTVDGDIVGQLLTLSSAQMKHAGIYTCSALLRLPNKTGKLFEKTSQLTILESEPLCAMSNTYVRKGSYIEMSCNATFNGTWGPTMEWKQHKADDDNDEGSLIKDGHSAIYVNDKTVTSTAKILADTGSNNSSFSCRTYFTTTSSHLITNATNAPDYSYTWNSSNVQVLCGPTEVVISPQQETFCPGDVLTCTAAGASSNPEFVWQNLETGDSFAGSELVIRTSTVRQERHRFECKAIHVITASELRSIPIQFTVKSRCAEKALYLDTHLLTAAAIGLVLVIVIVALSLYIVSLKRRNRGPIGNGIGPRPREETTMISTLNNTDQSEYSEIPSYGMCREAVSRCGYNRPASNIGYLPMSQNSSLCRAPLAPPSTSCFPKGQTYQNNEYIGPDDEVSNNPRYSIHARATANTPNETETNEDTMKDAYVDLTLTRPADPAVYTVLAPGAVQYQDPQPKNNESQIVEMKEQQDIDHDDYMEPVPTG